MSKIKEFYHEELEEEFIEDFDQFIDDWFDGAAEQALKDMEDELIEVNMSGMPKHFHPKF